MRIKEANKKTTGPSISIRRGKDEPTKTIIVCGSRLIWSHPEIQKWFEKCPKNTLIVCGGGRGVDAMVERMCAIHDLSVDVYHAQWDLYGKLAGPIRNRLMLNSTKPNKVVAFHYTATLGKGTRHMVTIAKKAGIHTETYILPSHEMLWLDRPDGYAGAIVSSGIGR